MTAAPLPTARLALIREAVALCPGQNGDPPAYHDRRDLLAHVDYLEDLLARAETALGRGGPNAAPKLRGALPLVMYFATEPDRDEFIALVQEAKPTFVMRKV